MTFLHSISEVLWIFLLYGSKICVSFDLNRDLVCSAPLSHIQVSLGSHLMPIHLPQLSFLILFFWQTTLNLNLKVSQCDYMHS